VGAGVTFEMSTKHIHYLPNILNHIHDLQAFYHGLHQLRLSVDVTISDRRLLKEVLVRHPPPLRPTTTTTTTTWCLMNTS
jgi:hypothetical protein